MNKPLQPGERQLLGDILDDKGLELAETLLHERLNGGNVGLTRADIHRALTAISLIRTLFTKRR